MLYLHVSMFVSVSICIYVFKRSIPGCLCACLHVRRCRHGDCKLVVSIPTTKHCQTQLFFSKWNS